MVELSTRMRTYLFASILSIGGSLPVTAFYLSALFPGYSSLQLSDTGGALMIVPLVVGILFGALLSEYDLRIAAFGVMTVTVLSSILIAIFIVSPIIAGVAAAIPAATPEEVIEVFIAQRILLFIVIAFPIMLLGAVIGNAISGRIIPSEELKQELERLRAETKEWHRLLEEKGGLPKEKVKESSLRKIEEELKKKE